MRDLTSYGVYFDIGQWYRRPFLTLLKTYLDHFPKQLMRCAYPLTPVSTHETNLDKPSQLHNGSLL